MKAGRVPRYGRNWSPYRSAYSRRGPGLNWVWCEEQKDYIMPLGECEKCRSYCVWDPGHGSECKFHSELRQEYERELAEKEEAESGGREDPVEELDEDEEESGTAGSYPYTCEQDKEAYEKLNSLDEQDDQEDEEDEDEEDDEERW